jgi:hypothetical protein
MPKPLDSSQRTFAILLRIGLLWIFIDTCEQSATSLVTLSRYSQ